jgi:hypothetical protein
LSANDEPQKKLQPGGALFNLSGSDSHSSAIWYWSELNIQATCFAWPGDPRAETIPLGIEVFITNSGLSFENRRLNYRYVNLRK